MVPGVVEMSAFPMARGKWADMFAADFQLCTYAVGFNELYTPLSGLRYERLAIRVAEWSKPLSCVWNLVR